MSKIVLENTGMAVKGKTDIGRWEYGGKSKFRGKLLDSKEWSPWMKMRELRDWFLAQAEKSN